MAKYIFKSSGSTRGSVTGQFYRFSPGLEVEAPEGEFKQLGGGDVDKVKARKKVAETRDPGGVDRMMKAKPRKRKDAN